MRKYLFAALAFLFASPAVAATDWPTYPPSAVPTYIVSSVVANTQIVLTMPAEAGRRNFATDLVCSSDGANAAAEIDIVVTGLMGGTRTIAYVVPQNLTQPPVSLGKFADGFAVPAAAVNTAIVATIPAFGTGNTKTSCVLSGFTTLDPEG